MVGPKAIRSGRLAYNEAITETNNQQMLMVFVHNRYEESNNLLAVSSVTANVRMTSSAGIQAGFGDSGNYDGNLVPFSSGFIYEENPTISYTPVTGESYMRELTSPVPVSLFAQVTQMLPDPAYAYTMLLSSVNGIRNPSFLFDSQQDDPRFEQFVSIMTELTRQQCLHWSRSSDTKSVSLVIETGTVHSQELTASLLELLGLPEISPGLARLVIPVSVGLSREESGGISVTTRSVFELVEILSAAVEVSVEDESNGAAAIFPRQGRAGRNLRIHHADARPEEAYVTVEHHSGWFYIHRQDRATKRYFKLLGSLWSAAMAHSLGGRSSAPILTVPVSR